MHAWLLAYYSSLIAVNNLFQRWDIKEDHKPPVLRKLERDPRSDAALKLASDWLETCLAHHSLCNQTSVPRFAPRRLMNVGCESRNPFLVQMDSTVQDVG